MVDDDRIGGSEEGVPFNMALATLKRISLLREEQIGARMRDDVNNWQHSLNSMFNELLSACALNAEQLKTYDKYHNQFVELTGIHKASTCAKEISKQGRKHQVQTCAHGIQFHDLCHRYETALLTIGLQFHIFMPSTRDPSVAFR